MLMPDVLRVVIAVFILVFLFYVLKNIKEHKLNIKGALIWIVLSICIILCLFNLENLKALADLAGIETVSNMVFFLGFIFLLFVCFNLTRSISNQNREIVRLTQELGLLKNKMDCGKCGNTHEGYDGGKE